MNRLKPTGRHPLRNSLTRERQRDGISGAAVCRRYGRLMWSDVEDGIIGGDLTAAQATIRHQG
jgi:hypothetical protein